MVTNAAKQIGLLAGEDQLSIESNLQPGIWDRLTVQCHRSNGTRCALVCQGPCCQAKQCIEHLMPVYFENYARWN